jgi:hypothetical protein
MKKEYSDRDIEYLMYTSLFYKIRANVRMITMEFYADRSMFKLFCYVDNEPQDMDKELMEEAAALFIAVSDLIESDVQVIVERSLKPWMELYGGRHILFARYEFPDAGG